MLIFHLYRSYTNRIILYIDKFFYSYTGPLAFADSHEVHTIIGVVSFGPFSCVDSIIPSVFARVNHVMDWIRFYVKNSDDICPPEILPKNVLSIRRL